MGKKKYRRYKNSFEMWMASKKGKRVLNFLYSWGASIVILGALFKLLHLPFGNEMLFIGMITEFFVFFVSGFEQPEDQYRWEQVFPELDSQNPMDREETEARRQYLLEKAKRASEQLASSQEQSFQTDRYLEPHLSPMQKDDAATSSSLRGQENEQGLTSVLSSALPQDQVERLSAAIDQLSNASEQLSRLGQLSDRMTQQWQEMLLNPEEMGRQAESYKEQMANLQRNIAGLNTIYEIQLKGVSGQIDTIDHINSGLSRIRSMYDNTVIDSSTFQRENERMAQQLAELNRVYARILEALTTNIASSPMGSHPLKERSTQE